MSIPSLSLATVPVPRVLTVAGSDSGGGAGIQADLKTFAAFHTYGMSAVTALTAQNTLGVQGVHVVPPEFVVEQLKSLFDDDLRPDAVKFGMLAGAETIAALADYFSSLAQAERPFLVLDPVMISTSGHALLPDAATATLSSRLLPLVDLVTPNIPEAHVLTGTKNEVRSIADMLALAAAVEKTCGAAVLLKGGHVTLLKDDVRAAVAEHKLTTTWAEDADGANLEVLADFRATLGLKENPEVVVDILAANGKTHLFVGPKIDSKSTHGTGCTLSAALAAVYALEKHANPNTTEISPAAVRRAIAYTQDAIAAAHPLGRGHGPLNHAHLSQRRTLPPPTEHNPTPFMSHLIRAAPDLWRSYVRHPFVVQLGQGTLPRESFKHYIIQDYHYLKHYARLHALGAYKADSFALITAFTDIAAHIAHESTMHVGFCKEFGVSLEELEAAPESGACAAYARYMLDVGAQGDVLDIYIAVASCLIGYGEVGLWLRSRVATGEAVLEGNPYARWMNDYAGDGFMDAVRRGIKNLEARIAADPPSPERLARLTNIWTECVRLERNFWEMGLKRLE